MPNIPQLPFEAENCKFIKEKHQKLFNLAKMTWNIAVEFIEYDQKIGAGNTTRFNMCLAGIFAKQLRLFLGTYRLCEHGLDVESLLLLRAMFETFINLKAVSESPDKEEYARQLIIWDLANGGKLSKYLANKYPDKKEQIEIFNKNLDEEKKNYSDDEWKQFVRHGPAKVNLHDLAEKVGMGEAYRVFYPFSSGTAHGYDVTMYAKISDDEGIQASVSPSENLVDSNLATAIHTLCDSLGIINSLLNLKKDKEVADLQKIAQSLRTHMKSTNEDDPRKRI